MGPTNVKSPQLEDFWKSSEEWFLTKLLKEFPEFPEPGTCSTNDPGAKPHPYAACKTGGEGHSHDLWRYYVPVKPRCPTEAAGVSQPDGAAPASPRGMTDGQFYPEDGWYDISNGEGVCSGNNCDWVGLKADFAKNKRR